MEPELLTSRELAARLGVREETIRRWTRQGHLEPAEVTYAGHYRFDADDARRQLDARRFVRPGRARS